MAIPRALVAAIMLYALSCVWLLLFPLFSVSTGELRPRKMYVDEHAMLVNSVVTDSEYSCAGVTASTAVLPQVEASGVCEAIRQLSLNRSHVECAGDSKIVIDSRHNPRSYDVITIPIVFTQRNKHIALDLSVELTEIFYNASWLSKRVVMLLLPENCSSIYESAYDRRHNDLCTYSPGGSISSVKFSHLLSRLLQQGETEGLRREAHIVDLTDTTYEDSGGEEGGGSCSSGSCSSGSLPFNAAKLLVTGVGGNLPNMDVLASAMVVTQQTTGNVRSNRVIVEGRGYFHRRSGRRNGVGDLAKYLEITTAVPVVTRQLLQLVCTAVDATGAGAHFEEYLHRLVGLLEFLFAAAGGGGAGLQTQLTTLNVDALTVRASYVEPIPGISNPAFSSVPFYSTCDIVEMVIKLARISSNLHEDLHHSHNHYLIMENTHFVGLSEFAWPLLLMLLTLLACYMYSFGEARVALASAGGLCVHTLQSIVAKTVGGLMFEAAMNHSFIYLIFTAVENRVPHFSSRDLFLVWKCLYLLQFLASLMAFLHTRHIYLLKREMRICTCGTPSRETAAESSISLAMCSYQTAFLLYFALLLSCYALLTYSLAILTAVVALPVVLGLLMIPHSRDRGRNVLFFFVLAVLYASSPIGLLSLDTLISGSRAQSLATSLLLDFVVLRSPTLPFIQSVFSAISCLAFRVLIVHFS